ncbi:MAG: Serine hydroxymethyltransferase [Candidatus Roizmanbacteria bacterium GW2011_GWA2_37_7]|uniref:Serine hydroxymethyltransferase n=1 Tax=Candidatus Roizmanbacteria bacterium GW2011_GWA2_37_7 TaxID=1618481 RepID=A0A0G0GZI9_9BACT|nr:MAG: Serine hydroxymethyltransferase [Candidatus Roizmanbacteria bacterium GW2011_GWA2_37_7]
MFSIAFKNEPWYSMNVKKMDNQITDLIQKEAQRQAETLMMIPSENYAPKEVREAVGSILMNKYSEGYAHERYYQGNKIIDQIETIAIERAKKLFNVPYANVQPLSGSPANTAIYFALLELGDKLMGLKLRPGGHLTHGHPKVTLSGKYFTSVQYDVNEKGIIDMDEVEKLAKKEKPKLIVVGTTAYPHEFDWKRWRKIADSVGSYLLADISHIAGLVASGAHSTPVPYVDIVMFTTHKTLRGPRGAVILVTKQGLAKDSDMAKKIDKAIIPGTQGGPHNNTTAAIAMALKTAGTAKFRKYSQQIVKNAKVLSKELMQHGLTLTTGGTDNHLMVIDLRSVNVIGNIYAEALEAAGIVVNRNSVPHDENPPYYPSGVRLGTPGVTTRGMKEREMKKIAFWYKEVLDEVKQYQWPTNKEERRDQLKSFRKALPKIKRIRQIAKEVKNLCKKYPIPD